MSIQQTVKRPQISYHLFANPTGQTAALTIPPDPSDSVCPWAISLSRLGLIIQGRHSHWSIYLTSEDSDLQSLLEYQMDPQSKLLEHNELFNEWVRSPVQVC